MKRLKDTAGFFLLLLLSLCLVSTPVFAEHPWTGDIPPGTGQEGDGPPGPRGGKVEEDVSHSGTLRTFSCSGFVVEISYYLADLVCGNAKTVSTVRKPSVDSVKPASASKVE